MQISSLLILFLAAIASGQVIVTPNPQAADPVARDLGQIQADYATVQAASNSQHAADRATIAAQAQQIATLQQSPAATPTTQPVTRSLGINLEKISYYGRNFAFADAMLSGQNFYSGSDASGNPTTDQGVILIYNLTPNMAGTYTLRCDGHATFSLQASLGVIGNSVYDPSSNTTTAPLTVNADQISQSVAAFGSAQIGFKVSNVVAGGVENIQCWRPGATIGQRFYSPFVKLLTPFDFVRGMDFLGATNSAQVDWSDRPLSTDRNYTQKGVDYEDFYGLCAAAGNKIPWVCLPAGATDDYFAKWVAMTKAHNLPAVYVEFSNECWNWGMGQCAQTYATAQTDTSLQYGTFDPNIVHYRYIAKRLQSLSQIACKAYGVTDIRQTPIRPVLCGQWGNPDVLKYGLEYLSHAGTVNQQIWGAAIAPYAVLPTSVQGRINANDPTLTAADVLAGYRQASLNGSTADPLTVAFMAQASQYSLHKLFYEAGEDSGQSPNCMFQKIAAARDPRNGPIVANYIINGWQAGIEGFGFFLLTYAPDQFGQWGLVEDPLNPVDAKYAAAKGVGTLLSN